MWGLVFRADWLSKHFLSTFLSDSGITLRSQVVGEAEEQQQARSLSSSHMKKLPQNWLHQGYQAFNIRNYLGITTSHEAASLFASMQAATGYQAHGAVAGGQGPFWEG